MENKNQKDTRMYLRVTQSDKKQIVRLAEICGLSQSEYLRQRALGFAPRAVLPDVFFDFNQTLCRLCLRSNNSCLKSSIKYKLS